MTIGKPSEKHLSGIFPKPDKSAQILPDTGQIRPNKKDRETSISSILKWWKLDESKQKEFSQWQTKQTLIQKLH